MPHQCTSCSRVFDDGSKEMLSGCPDCGGTTFQFRPDGADFEDAPDAEPPERPEPPGGSVTRTVGKTAATVRDVMSGSSDVPESRPDGHTTIDDDIIVAEENTAQASARSDLASPDELAEAAADTTADANAAPSESIPAGTEGESRREPSADTANEAGDADTEVTADESPTASPSADDPDRPDLDQLRAELNDQFESIKVVSPGQYELNLMELYDREEYIVALQEDGKYSIQVPERFQE